MLVVGVNLIHLLPQLLGSYHNQHGVVQLHHCFFSGRTVACGNCTHPLTSKNIRNILARLESTSGFFGTVYELTEECLSEQSDRCVTLLSAAVSSAPAVPAEAPVARAAPPGLDIHPEEEVEPWDPARPFAGSESEVSTAIVAEDRKLIFHGVVTPGLQARMERGTAPKLVPRHRLNKDCQS